MPSQSVTDKLTDLLLKLDDLAATSKVPVEEYQNILLRIAKDVPLTDTNINTVLYHVHRLRAWDIGRAHHVLVNVTKKLVSEGGSQSWLEKFIITIIWNFMPAPESTDVLSMLQEVFEDVSLASKALLGSTATHAAQVLLWKRFEGAYHKGEFETSISWCRLSLHAIFSSCGPVNEGKIRRRMIMCALSMSEPDQAKTFISDMSDAVRQEASTQYLLFKAALLSKDFDTAAECLGILCRSSIDGDSFIYSCVIEAQRCGDSGLALTSMRHVLARYEANPNGGLHIPALLRSYIRLLIRELSCSETQSPDQQAETCHMFELAVTEAKTTKSLDREVIFSTLELDWFSKNAYNLALNFCTLWDPHHTVRLVEASERLLELYPNDISQELGNDLSLRRMFCAFLSSSLYLITARCEKDSDKQLHSYSEVRKAVDKWRCHFHGQLERLEGLARQDLQKKHISLLMYDFEAAAILKAWGSFQNIIDDCQKYNVQQQYAILADITLSSGAPEDVIVGVVQQIVDATCTSTAENTVTLARWVRCLISLAFTSEPTTAEKIVEKILHNLASRSKVLPSLFAFSLRESKTDHAGYYVARQERISKRGARMAGCDAFQPGD